jgi:hypothetical protein
MFDGMVPIREFWYASNLISCVIVTMVEGIVPLRLLLSNMSDLRDTMLDTAVEMVPVIEFDPTYNPVSPLIVYMLVGIVPAILL